MDILRMLDQLQDAAVEKPRTFLGVTIGFDKDEIAMHIAKVRASLPTEVKQAATVTRESERIVEAAKEDAAAVVAGAKKERENILEEARRDAARIIEQARLEQARMLAESEILKLAKAQSEEIRNAAERDATHMRRGAEQYALDVLNQLESVVGKVMTSIDRGRAEISPPEQSLPQIRDRVRV